MSTKEHGDILPGDGVGGTEGNHVVERWPAVADEAARATLGAGLGASDRGGIVRQTGGTLPGWYIWTGAAWLYIVVQDGLGVLVRPATASGAVAPTNADDIVIDSGSGSGLSILSGNAAIGRVNFGDGDDSTRGRINYDHATDSLSFDVANAAEAMRILSSGDVGIGEVSPATRLHVKAAIADSSPLAQLQTTGTNGEDVRMFVGTRDPNGLISGNPGDIYLRHNGSSSSVYVNTGAADANTTWTNLSMGASAVQGDLFCHPMANVNETAAQIIYNGNMKGALFLNPTRRLFNTIALHTGASWSGTFDMRICLWQASDGAFANMDLLFNETVSQAVAAANATFTKATSGGDITLAPGYYVLGLGRSSGTGSPFIESFTNADQDLFTRMLSGGPTNYDDLGSASTPADPISPQSESSAGATGNIPIHKLRYV